MTPIDRASYWRLIPLKAYKRAGTVLLSLGSIPAALTERWGQ